MAAFSINDLARHTQFPGVSASDAAHLAQVIAPAPPARRDGLIQLLNDPPEALQLLDRPEFVTAIHIQRTQLQPSLCLYVDIRRALLGNHIDNRSLAIYLTNVWTDFRASGILPSLGTDQDGMLPTVEILRQLNFLKGPAAFELMARSGNYYLFLMALFEPFFERRQRRHGAPGIAYYEAFARCAFRSARDHGLAGELALKEVYHDLSEHLGSVRLALASLN